MTVIAWDGKRLVADKMGSNFGLKRKVTKIRRIHGMLVGCAGSLSLAKDVMHWIEAGCDPNRFPKDQRDEDKAVTVICILTDGRIMSYWTSPIAHEIEEPFHAIGSGRDFAIATMGLGFDASKAVEIACQYMNDCGYGVDTLLLEAE